MKKSNKVLKAYAGKYYTFECYYQDDPCTCTFYDCRDIDDEVCEATAVYYNFKYDNTRPAIYEMWEMNRTPKGLRDATVNEIDELIKAINRYIDTFKEKERFKNTTESIKEAEEAAKEIWGTDESSETESVSEVKETALEEAQRILNGDRNVDYGDPLVSFKKISELATELGEYHISPLDCVNVLIAVKLVRESYKHKRDNLVDLIAYAEIKNRIIDEMIEHNVL